MAVGTHWEWRAFGPIPLALLLNVIGKLNKHFGPDDTGNQHTDEYLWTPGSDVNVKLRDDKLKFKRLLDTDDGCELWTEEEDETFPFPLTDAALDFISRHMSVGLPDEIATARNSLADFRQSLASFTPPIRVVPVNKHRIQYDAVVGEATLIIELAEVIEPVSTWSVAIEGEDLLASSSSRIDPETSAASLARIAQVREQLNLPGTMAVKGYLDMLADWC